MNTAKEGTLVASGLKVAVVAARFNQFVTERLLEGALDAFSRHGGDIADVEVVRVPGAFELPLAVRRLAQGGRFDAIVALGAVIRGDTPHFDHVCSAATSGLAAAMNDTGVPVAFGLLTTNSLEQAMDRAGGKSGNKGADAMLTAVEMATLLKQME